MDLDAPSAPTTEVALGDILRLPPAGHAHTVRGVARLVQPTGPLAGFVVVGELHHLLGTPAHPGAPAILYSPLRGPSAPPARFQSLVEGVLNYWAPHLPPQQAAMAELAFRVIAVRGRLEPVVIVYRGDEAVVFVRSADLDLAQVRVTPVPRAPARDDYADHPVTRVAAVVGPAWPELA